MKGLLIKLFLYVTIQIGHIKVFVFFAQWNCERRLRGEEENVFVHVGECNQVSPIFVSNEEDCPSKCSHQLRPVCDSNGITHPNLCAYKLYRCLQRKVGNKYKINFPERFNII
uniref:Kazal-like domain-containing protein n=1 Tax=Meloidogyne incognita TaxID=6306 RepID=A0A914NAJ9_MELIC